MKRRRFSVDRPDTDLAVGVTDVHPDGTSNAINGPEAGYLRLRYREGLDRQVLMEPGRIYPVRIGGMLTSNVFKKGHRIRLQITSSRAPHYDPNPNSGGDIATATKLQSVGVTIHHDAAHPSRVILPLIPRGEEVPQPHAAGCSTESGAVSVRNAQPSGNNQCGSPT